MRKFDATKMKGGNIFEFYDSDIIDSKLSYYRAAISTLHNSKMSNFQALYLEILGFLSWRFETFEMQKNLRRLKRVFGTLRVTRPIVPWKSNRSIGNWILR